MASHNHLYQQIASGTSVGAGLSLIPDTDTLAVVDSRRYGYLDFLPACNVTGSMTVTAFLLDNLAGSVAFRTGLYIADRAEKGLLSEYHLAFTTAFGTGFRTGPRLCPGSVTRLALIL